MTGASVRLSGHVAILRLDHWFKNVFVLPGVAIAVSIAPEPRAAALAALLRLPLALLAIGLVASSNYTLNELLDAGTDRHHPSKALRPVPLGQVSVPIAYAQWLLLMLAGFGLGLLISQAFAATMLALWFMGLVYNVAPIRSKELPYLDVLSEAVNNPIRLLAGWYTVGAHAVPPLSLLMSYWMIGAYFMAMKRYAEYRHINDPEKAAAYRRSFAHYNEPRLLTSIVFYGAAAMLFLGAFIMRYRIELILSYPFIALVMASYMRLAAEPDSAVQRPEELYRQPKLMIAVVLCTVVLLLCLFIDVPALDELFVPTIPPR